MYGNANAILPFIPEVWRAADRRRAWSRQLKDKKGGSHYYKTDKKETERNNEKTEGWNKARKNDEQFAFVLARKRRVGVRMHMVMKGACE